MEFSSKPHQKDLLTTKFGRKVDSISYKTLFRISFYIWLSASVYFCFATFSGHGMNTMQGSSYWCESFFTALYFSGVTITTLGYGDISPVGIGRTIALLLAFTGVTVFTIFVAKISSERQSSILLLLHTSDIEKRLSTFSENLNTFSNDIFIDNSDNNESLYAKLKNANKLVEGISKYSNFHFNQTFFVELGTSTSINRLIDSFYKLQKALIDNKHYGVSEAKVERAILSLSNKLQKMEIALEYFTNKKKQKNITVKKHLRDNHIILEKWYSSQVTESLKLKVLEKLGDTPRDSWPKHPHKILAKEFNVSNKLASKCITQLTEEGRL